MQFFSCSHAFRTINLSKTTYRRVELTDLVRKDGETESDKRPAEIERDRELEKLNDIEKKNTLDQYVKRMNKANWPSETEYYSENHRHNFLEMSLYEFAKKYDAAKKKGDTKYKIYKHSRDNNGSTQLTSKLNSRQIYGI